MASAPEAFELRVSEEELKDLKDRLARTRWPDDGPENGDWEYGASTSYIKSLAQFWQDCDWRAQEAYLNGGLGCGAKHYKVRLPQYVDSKGEQPGPGLQVHYVHAKAASGSGVPLLLLHGWPGSWYEFHRMFAPLTKAGFDVIAPSLPGYGFSEPPRTPGFGPVSMARTFDLMMRTIGYPAYVAQGGDWGSAICGALGKLVSTNVISGPKAIHTNMVGANPPPAKDLAELEKNYSDLDRRGLKGRDTYNAIDSGYSKIQGTKPQTVGTALNDSPAGLLAWIVEKLRTWSDCNGNVENCFSKMDMITNVSMYWFGKAATSSARLYFEGPFGGNEFKVNPGALSLMREKTTCPFGFALFPKEIFWVPKSWIPYSYSDVKRWSEMPKGGHFAAWEQPELLGKEVEDFFLKDVDARKLCNVAGGSKL